MAPAAHFDQTTKSSFLSRKFLREPPISALLSAMFPVRFATSLLAAVLLCATVSAQTQTPVIVYDNSSNPEGVYQESSEEYGDEVVLSGTARYVTEIDFEYTAD